MARSQVTSKWTGNAVYRGLWLNALLTNWLTLSVTLQHCTAMMSHDHASRSRDAAVERMLCNNLLGRTTLHLLVPFAILLNSNKLRLAPWLCWPLCSGCWPSSDDSLCQRAPPGAPLRTPFGGQGRCAFPARKWRTCSELK